MRIRPPQVIDPGTVTIPQYRVNKTKQHTHTHHMVPIRYGTWLSKVPSQNWYKILYFLILRIPGGFQVDLTGNLRFIHNLYFLFVAFYSNITLISMYFKFSRYVTGPFTDPFVDHLTIFVLKTQGSSFICSETPLDIWGFLTAANWVSFDFNVSYSSE